MNNMNLLDLISVLDANDVTPLEFEETWGITKEEYLNDMRSFIEGMYNEDINLKPLGIRGRTKEEILEELTRIYGE